MRIEGLMCFGFILGCEAVKFTLPPDHRSRSGLSSEPSSSETSSSDSSSDSSVEYVNDENGRFSRLKKDDDLLSLKKQKTKKKNRKQSKPIKVKVSDFSVDREGGKQTVGLLWNKELMENIGGNGWSKEMEAWTTGIVKEPINAGWWLFTFGTGSSSVSRTSFKFKTQFPVRVSLVDLFCRGDSFAILDSGKLIAQSSRILADKEGCGGCETVISPQEALKDGRWSSVILELEAGNHEITLKSVDSPMENGGTAAIRFDHIIPAHIPRKISRNKVCRGYNGLFVITEPLEADEAELACLAMKSCIARVEKGKDDLIVRRSIKSCTDGEVKVWAKDGIDDELKVFRKDGTAQPVPDKEKKELKYPVLCRASE